jgi:hypothetical protein
MIVGTLVYMLMGAATGFFSAMSSEYRSAMVELRTLRGILPICANCKKIRDGDGYWHQVESNISSHSSAWDHQRRQARPNRFERAAPPFARRLFKGIGLRDLHNSVVLRSGYLLGTHE